MQGPSFATQDIGLFERLIQVFYAPRASFIAVYQRETSHDWLVPVLLATVVGIASYFITQDILLDPESPDLKQQLQHMTEEQQQNYLKGMREKGWMIVPVGTFSTLVIVSGILLLLGRSVFNSEITYQQMLIAKGYASLVLIPEWIVRTALTLVNETGRVHTGLGAFVPEEMAHTFVGKVLISIDFFDCWQVWVLGTGLAMMAEVPVKRAVVAILVLWGIWIVGGAAVESLSTTLPPPVPE